MDKMSEQARNRILIRAIDHYGDGFICLRTIEALGEMIQSMARLRSHCVDPNEDKLEWIAEAMAMAEISFDVLKILFAGLADRAEEWQNQKLYLLQQRMDADDDEANHAADVASEAMAWTGE